MATLKSTGGSLLNTVEVAAKAVTTGVNGTAVWLHTWAAGVQDRAETQRTITSTVEAGKRKLAPELAAVDLSTVVESIHQARASKPEAFDQALELLKNL